MPPPSGLSCGTQYLDKNSLCGSKMDHKGVDNINYKQKYKEMLYCNQAKKQKENKKTKSKEKKAQLQRQVEKGKGDH